MRNADFPLHPRFNLYSRLGAVASVAWGLTKEGFNVLAHARTVREMFAKQAQENRKKGVAFTLTWPQISQKSAIMAP